MKKIHFIIVIAGALSITSCHNTKDVVDDTVTEVKDNTPIYKNVTAEEFKDLLKTNPGTLVDVRTAEEFKGGYIRGAINIDYFSPTFKDDISTIDKSKPVYVYCRSGNRSGKAMLILQDLGYNEVYNLIGGYSQWPKPQPNPNQVPIRYETK